MIARMSGPFFKAELLDKDWFPENYYFDYLQANLPAICYDNPRVNVRSRAGSAELSATATAMRYGMNRWARDTDVQVPLLDVCRDMMMVWGAMITVNEPVAGSDIVERWELSETGWKQGPGFAPRRPRAYRLSQRRFGMDPLALEIEECRFMYHRFIRSRAEVEAEANNNPAAGWNKKLIRMIPREEGWLSSGWMEMAQEREGKQAMPRDEIQGWEVWVPEHNDLPEHREEPGKYHGTIYTIAEYDRHGVAKPDWLREPRAYYGPPWGPYTVFGAYRVPDDIWPLSPLVASEGQIRELNKHAKALSRNAAERKKVGIFDRSDAEAADLLTNARDGEIIGVSGARRDLIFDLEVGGLSQEQLEFYGLLLERAQRATGLHSARRGSASNATATAVSLAEQALSERLSYIKKRFAHATTQVLRTAAWFLHHDDRVWFPLGEDAVPQYGPSPVFQGGGNDVPFDDLELEIEAQSMERANEGLHAARMGEAFQVVAGAAPVMKDTPWIDWTELLERYGDSRNLPGLGSLFRPEVAAEMLGISLQQGLGEQSRSGQSQPVPRLVGDLGLRATAGGTSGFGGQSSLGGARGSGLEGNVSGAVAGGQARQAAG